ncbi:hypothetical protein Tco_1361005 [Tanacetum coccineum]
MPTFFSDYIGCLRSTGSISDFGDPNRRKGVRRKIEIENLNPKLLCNFKAETKELPYSQYAKVPLKTFRRQDKKTGFHLKTIMDQNPQSIKGVRFTAEATITGINMNKDWYKFKGYITDNTATAPITFFTPAANKVTDHPCTELVEKYKPADPTKIPPEILAAQGKHGVFQFHFNTLGKLTDLSLDAVYDVQKQDHSTSSSTQEINKGDKNFS